MNEKAKHIENVVLTRKDNRNIKWNVLYRSLLYIRDPQNANIRIIRLQ